MLKRFWNGTRRSGPGASSTRGRRSLVALCGIAACGLLAPALHATASSPATFNVLSYGADPSGTNDSGRAIQKAIDAAQSAGTGSIVYVPTGTYSLLWQPAGDDSLVVNPGTPIVIHGDGATASVLVQGRGKNALHINTDGSEVDNVGVVTQSGLAQYPQVSSFARAALVVSASNTTVQHIAITGGAWYAVYYPGPTGASATAGLYDTGNQFLNSTVSDLWTLDGFSFSFQQAGLIQNVTHTGSRLAIFISNNVEVDNYTYHQGPQHTKPGGGGTQGFWITPPSNNITINGFRTDGNGGTLGANTAGDTSTNISITNLVFTSSQAHMSIGEVNGLTLDGCNFNGNNELRFKTNSTATGVVVKNCTLGPVRFGQSGSVSAQFNNDTFTSFTPAPQQGSQSIWNTNNGPTDFTVNGGTFQNCAGGFFKGPATTFAVNGLSGYPCNADSPPVPGLSLSPSSGSAPLQVTADGSTSTDTDQTPIAWYQFSWGDGTVSPRQAAATATHTYGANGTYSVSLTVGDTAGLNASTPTQTVTVSPDESPTAALTVTPSSGNAPLLVTADASASSDPDSQSLTYTFDFGDGTVTGPQSSATATHTYRVGNDNPGYQVTVTVTDPGGLTSQASKTVTVTVTNLITDPSFESGTAGWAVGKGDVLSWGTTAHTGSHSAQVSFPGGSGRALLTDRPGFNRSTTAGTTCTVAVWVLGPTGSKVTLRTSEFKGSTNVGNHLAFVVASSTTWKQIVVSAPIVNGGDSLHLSIFGPLPAGQSLFVDDASESCA